MNPNCSKALLRLACADGAILSTSIVPLYLVVVVVVVFVTTVVFTVLVLEPFFQIFFTVVVVSILLWIDVATSG